MPSSFAGRHGETFFRNKDTGSTREDVRKQVRFEASNFTGFKSVQPTATNVNHDEIDQSQILTGSVRDDGWRPVQLGLVYATLMELASGSADPARHELCDRVRPGISVQAEIKIGRRRINQFLLSPISKALSEAGRED